MKKTSLLVGAAVLALAACSGEKKTAMNSDLKKDLDLASSSDGIGVGTGVNQGTQVVSAIERTTPAPKKPAASAVAHRYHKAPTKVVAPVETEAPAIVTAPEPTPVAPQPVAVDPNPPVAPRPTPQTVSYPGGNTGSVSRGPSAGSIIGAVLGAVIRGAVVGGIGMGDGDSCDPRTERGRRGPTSINQRFPGRIGTYPMQIPRIGTFPR